MKKNKLSHNLFEVYDINHNKKVVEDIEVGDSLLRKIKKVFSNLVQIPIIKSIKHKIS
jgi:hypothetical protein